MKVKDLMTRGSACCTPDQSVREAARVMEQNDCGCVPVEDSASGKLVGVISDRDIALRVVGQGKSPDVPIREVMSSDPSCCGPDDDVEVAERIMAERQVRRVPVIDGDGKAVGIVAQADLATNRGRIGDREVAQVVASISKPSRTPRREVAVGRQPSLH
jgi:CBS domain-containing protein